MSNRPIEQWIPQQTDVYVNYDYVGCLVETDGMLDHTTRTFVDTGYGGVITRWPIDATQRVYLSDRGVEIIQDGVSLDLRKMP